MKITWIGTGVMGTPMASHLLDGNQLTVYNRHPEKAKKLAELGAVVADDLSQAVSEAEVVFTMVAYPKDVESIYLDNGIFNHVPAGTICVDMTTSSPQLAKRLALEGEKRGIEVLDAPVSGGDIGAVKATLTIMVGGSEQAYQKVLPLLEKLGTHVTYMGGPSMGQQTKAANQIGVAGASAALAEALTYAQSVGLDPQKVIQVISQGAAGSWQMDHNASRIFEGDYAPGFYIKHFIKDLKIVREEAANQHLDLAMVDTVCQMYEDLAAAGYSDFGTQALVKYYQKEKK